MIAFPFFTKANLSKITFSMLGSKKWQETLETKRTNGIIVSEQQQALI